MLITLSTVYEQLLVMIIFKLNALQYDDITLSFGINVVVLFLPPGILTIREYSIFFKL